MTGLHNRKVIAGLLVCLMAFAGCGAVKTPENVTDTCLIIDKEGSVTHHIVGVFDREYYDLDGLRKMAQEEAASYNTAHQTREATKVAVQRVEELAGNAGSVVVTYLYDRAETYEDYSGSTLFYGTVGEAGQDGYDFAGLNQVLFDPKGEKSIVSSEVSKMTKKHVILLGENTKVYCPYKVAYLSEEAVALEDGCIDTTGVAPGQFPVIIVLQK